MKKESLERINALKKEIQELNVQINEKSVAIEDIYLREHGKYKGSYIEYYDGDKKEYIYMKVDREIIREEGMKLELCGPAVILDDTPLFDDDEWDDEYDKPDICSATFDYFYEINVSPATLAEQTCSTIKKVKKEDFKIVIDFLKSGMDEKFGC